MNQPDRDALERLAAFERGYIRGWLESPRLTTGGELWASKSHRGQDIEPFTNRVYWRGGYRQGAIDRKNSLRKLLTGSEG